MLTDPAALAYKGIVKVFLVAYSAYTLGQILLGFTLCEFSEFLFDLRHGGEGGRFLAFHSGFRDVCHMPETCIYRQNWSQ